MAVTNKLTALGVSRMKEPGRYADGGNLYLQVSETGTKSWLFRYMLAGKQREMGLGSVQTFTLAEARERARLQRQRLADGIDPIDHRRTEQAETALAKAQQVPFEECAQRYIDTRKAGWKNAKHADQWTSTLKTWAYPIIGKVSVGNITTDLVMQVLEQRVGEGEEAPTLWNAKTETANRVRGRIENILDWASARKLRHGDNPARWKGLLDKLLPARSQVAPTEPHPALPYRQLPEFISELRKRHGAGARALEFLILTTTRSHNVVGGQRAEIDPEERTWTIRAAAMKGRKGQRTRDHVIPLSDRALEVLKGMPAVGEYLFPSDEAGEPLSNAAMAAVIDRMNEDREGHGLPRWIDPKLNRDVVPHGFRSTFKDWASEQTAYPNEMSEMALGHTVPDKVEAAYRRGDMREKRRRLMDDWSKYCASPPRVASGQRVVGIRG